MVNWIIILVAVIAVIVVTKFIHFRHLKHRVTAITLILLALFLYSTFTAVIHSNNIDLKNASGIISAFKVYFVWLGQSFGNLKTLTGNAINMNWMPQNVSLSPVSG